MLRALMVFQLCGIKFLVQNNQHILNVMRRVSSFCFNLFSWYNMKPTI